MREFETHDNFYLTDCGECSGWIFNVMCKKSQKLGVIHINKCVNNDEYNVTADSLEDNCDISDRNYPTKEDQLIEFLTENFLRVDDKDPCYEYNIKNPICPDCYENPTIKSENDL